LNVNAAPDTAPVATADSYSTNEDTALTRNAAQGVLANDNDVDGNPLNAIKVTNPSHGSVTLNADGSFAYTPTANYNGADSFAYKANDGNLDSNTVAVIFTVNPANDAPTAVANSYTLNQDSVLSVTPPGVLGNDADPDGDVLRAIWVSGPFNGLLTLDQNGSFTYTPNAGYHGSDSFNYKAYDSQVDSNTVAVTISITQLQAMSISLYSPLDNTVTMNNQPDFKFIATHPSNPTLSCTLWLKLTTSSTPTAYGTDGNTVNGAPTIIIPSTPIPNGQYQWWINCTDSTTSIISEKRTITLNLFRGDRSFSASYDGSTRYYWLDLPDHFNSSAPTPLVIFLHGYGQDRSMYRTYFPVFRQIFHQNGWMVACPESRTISGYSAWYTAPSRSDITDVINLLEQEFNVDPSHIHVMGTSMGGSGTLKYAMFNPDIIASVCPIMGVTNFTEFYYWTPDSTLQNSIRTAYGGTPSQVPLVYNDESPLGNEIRFMHTPVFLLHGSADTVVPVSNSRNLYSSLTQAGYDVKYVEVQGVGHYATTLVEGHEQEIFEWFRDHPLHTEELPDNFAIVALPDTQFYSANINGVGVQIFNNQTQWAVNNVDGMNIVFVTHLGDVVDSYNDMTQWQNAYQSISRMEDQVPWAVLPGNHDGLNVGSPGEDLSNYITYFGAANSFQLFSAGFDDYLIFHFQYDADNNVLAWANSVIAQYPNRRVIVSTHSYLDLDGSRTAIGERLWQNFVGPHADQVFLVLCGHMHGEARRSDVVNGHTVHQILSDYQSRTNGGNGWLRILSFHPTEDKIYVNTYSPYLNSYESDLSSEFAIDYDMTSSKP
jgi:VCBS repeat-containing protein